MVGYYVEVPGMETRELTRFVRAHMPSQQELLRRARLARLPSTDASGAPLEDFLAAYRRVPSRDLTLRVTAFSRGSMVVQYASGGALTLKKGLRRIIQRHIARALRCEGIPCRYYAA